jgi:ubiquinone/menaquinone biosynthesis C-methylase UbiE
MIHLQRYVLTALFAAGCASTPPAPSPRAEESVHPGINDSFLAADLDVDQFTQRFEGESREIFVARKAILAAMALSEGTDVADIGAGTGLFMGAIAKEIGPDGRLYAVDLATKFIEHLAQRATQEGYPQVETVLCKENSVELPHQSIDTAFICDVYHHFEYPQSSLDTIFYALRPGGRLVLVDFHRIPGVSRDWTLEHVRAGQDVFKSEVLAAGFEFEDEVAIEGLTENYLLRFRKP